jgi:hypothetical protein
MRRIVIAILFGAALTVPQGAALATSLRGASPSATSPGRPASPQPGFFNRVEDVALRPSRPAFGRRATRDERRSRQLLRGVRPFWVEETEWTGPAGFAPYEYRPRDVFTSNRMFRELDRRGFTIWVADAGIPWGGWPL